MAKKTFNFELGNRDLFPSERAVVHKAKESLIASAARHGKTIDASALFRGKSNAMAVDAAEPAKTTGKGHPRKPA